MILYGQLYSKSNSRRLVVNRRTGRTMSIKSAPAMECVLSFQAQARAQWKGPPLEGPVSMEAAIFYQSRRSDLDCSLLQDILQGIAFSNDRQIERIVLIKGLDPKCPRVEVEITLRS